MHKFSSFNRRNFIKLLAGGALGTALSPLPWKLMDDLAIWTQNWPWVPVPAEGSFNCIPSVCTLCPGGCGITVRRVDGRPVKIEGRSDYPVNQGAICPLGAGGLQLLYQEEFRFKSPMKRVGPKGSGQFIEIQWDKALSEVIERLRGLRQKGVPQQLAVIDGSRPRSSMALLIQRFMEGFGSPNYLRICSAEDTLESANRLLFGIDRPTAYDLENSTFILSFGCGLIEGWGSPGRMLHAWGLWHSAPPKGRVKVVQIESRASNTASKSDQWLAPRPGTEAALALGIAHVLIKERLFDSSFLSEHAFGFSDWSSRDGRPHKGFQTLVLEQYAPSQVARMTGLTESDILSLGRDFGHAEAPVALCGKGKGDLPGSLLEFMSVQSLNALAGNLNKRGGIFFPEFIPLGSWPQVTHDSVSTEGLKKNRIDGAGSANLPFTQSSIHNLAAAVLEGAAPPVDTLLLFSSNPVYTLPDNHGLKTALHKVPWIVSFSPYRDETSLMADLILPDHTYLEKMEDIVGPPGLPYPVYGLSRPVIEPLYHTRAAGDVLITLAKGLGGALSSSFPWKNFEEAMKQRARALIESGEGRTEYDPALPPGKDSAAPPVRGDVPKSFDERWKEIRAKGLWYRPLRESRTLEDLFQTPSGKFEFYALRLEAEVAKAQNPTALLQAMGIHVQGDEAFMPHHEQGPASPEQKDYPLLLVVYELFHLSAGFSPNPPYVNKILSATPLRKKDSFVDIHPQTASAYSLKQGDGVVIQSRRASIKALVNLFEGAMPGVLYLPLGLGRTGFDDLHRDRGVNPLDLMDGEKDPLSGMPVWWQTRVTMMKA